MMISKDRRYASNALNPLEDSNDNKDGLKKENATARARPNAREKITTAIVIFTYIVFISFKESPARYSNAISFLSRSI